MSVYLQDGSFDPWGRVAEYQQKHPELAGQHGASCVFVGTMRDFNQDQRVERMILEHYPAMTQKQLQAICDEACQQWPVLETLVVHRYGPITPGEAIVLVATWAARRDAAFKASRYIIDALKTRAPFWKQEQTTQGRRWLEQEAP